MTRKSNDPIKSAARQSKAVRRHGVATSCTECGESRAEALVPRSRPRLCEECYRRRRGSKTTDAHHVAGKANSSIVIEVPANDHRAALSVAQYEWPKATLGNPDGSPILRAAAALRGVADLLIELIVGLIVSAAAFLENLDQQLRNAHGDGWWVGSPVAAWQP